MAVLSISITESSQQIISGIPKTISISTNVPSTIFYTLDGTTPTESSLIYTSAIQLPTNNSSVTVKIFATDGIDSSSIVTKTYSPNTSVVRQPRETVTNISPSANQMDKFPFGDTGVEPPYVFGRVGGVIVDDAAIENIPDGYDGTGTGTHSNGTDQPLSSYDFIYSTTNSVGEFGQGIGTLPGKVTVRVPEPVHPSTSSKLDDRFFNPRAMVIYQDSRNEPYDPNVSNLNRSLFSLQRVEVAKNGSALMNTAFDSNTVTGSFLRSHYNPADHTITYYYRDSDTNQWIISKEPYLPKNDNIGALYKMVFTSRGEGAGVFFKWVPFLYRRLI